MLWEFIRFLFKYLTFFIYSYDNSIYGSTLEQSTEFYKINK